MTVCSYISEQNDLHLFARVRIKLCLYAASWRVLACPCNNNITTLDTSITIGVNEPLRTGYQTVDKATIIQHNWGWTWGHHHNVPLNRFGITSCAKEVCRPSVADAALRCVNRRAILKISALSTGCFISFFFFFLRHTAGTCKDCFVKKQT